MNNGRAFGLTPPANDDYALPEHRKAYSGRTYSSPWDSPGGAITDSRGYYRQVGPAKNKPGRIRDWLYWIAAFALLALAFSAPAIVGR